MKTSYAVKWSEPDGRVYTGRLELKPRALRLEGRNGSGPVVREIGYEELRGLHIGQEPDERLGGQAALVLDRPGGPYLLTGIMLQAGVLQELIHNLAELKLAAPKRATVVVPIKEGTLDQVRALACAGPPFDPQETSLTRHQLLLTEHEAIFIFESYTPIETLLEQINVWAAAASWHNFIAGPPRLAEVAYAWERPDSPLEAIGLGL